MKRNTLIAVSVDVLFLAFHNVQLLDCRLVLLNLSSLSSSDTVCPDIRSVSNGIVVGDENTEGSTRHITCDIGFVSNSSIITCLNGTWSGTDTCTPRKYRKALDSEDVSKTCLFRGREFNSYSFQLIHIFIRPLMEL